MAWQAIAPVVPAVALAVIVGVLLPRFAIAGGPEPANIEVQRCVPSPGDPADSCLDTVYDATHQVLLTAERMPVTVHIPWGQVGLLAGGAIAATVVMTVVGLAFLRTSTRMTELRTS